MDDWSEQRLLAGLLHSLGSRLWRARLAIEMYEKRQDGTWPYPMWEYRYRNDITALLHRLGYPEWADAPMDTCCRSFCANPAVHVAGEDCIYDPMPEPEKGVAPYA